MQDRTCAHCLERMPERIRSDALYCSRDCMKRAHNKRRADLKRQVRLAKRAEQPPRQCAQCEAEIALEARATTIYCSVDCTKRAWYAKERAKLPPRTCGDCGAGVGKKTLYCTECARLRRCATTREYGERNPDKVRQGRRAYMARQQAERPEHMRRVKKLWRYSMTVEQLNEMERQQDNCCAICGVHETAAPRGSLNIDHDHACCNHPTRKTCGRCVRALLCNNCNWMLGLANDNLDVLLAAAGYIEKHRANRGALHA